MLVGGARWDDVPRLYSPPDRIMIPSSIASSPCRITVFFHFSVVRDSDKASIKSIKGPQEVAMKMDGVAHLGSSLLSV